MHTQAHARQRGMLAADEIANAVVVFIMASAAVTSALLQKLFTAGEGPGALTMHAVAPLCTVCTQCQW
jgi:hypothetical protein